MIRVGDIVRWSPNHKFYSAYGSPNARYLVVRIGPEGRGFQVKRVDAHSSVDTLLCDTESLEVIPLLEQMYQDSLKV